LSPPFPSCPRLLTSLGVGEGTLFHPDSGAQHRRYIRVGVVLSVGAFCLKGLTPFPPVRWAQPSKFCIFCGSSTATTHGTFGADWGSSSSDLRLMKIVWSERINDSVRFPQGRRSYLGLLRLFCSISEPFGVHNTPSATVFLFFGYDKSVATMSSNSLHDSSLIETKGGGLWTSRRFYSPDQA